MKRTELSKKEIASTFRKIRDEKLKENKKFQFERDDDFISLEQKDIWVISDSSTSFNSFDSKNYA